MWRRINRHVDEFTVDEHELNVIWMICYADRITISFMCAQRRFNHVHFTHLIAKCQQRKIPHRYIQQPVTDGMNCDLLLFYLFEFQIISCSNRRRIYSTQHTIVHRWPVVCVVFKTEMFANWRLETWCIRYDWKTSLMWANEFKCVKISYIFECNTLKLFSDIFFLLKRNKVLTTIILTTFSDSITSWEYWTHQLFHETLWHLTVDNDWKEKKKIWIETSQPKRLHLSSCFSDWTEEKWQNCWDPPNVFQPI